MSASGLPKDVPLTISWLNSSARGYDIGTIETDPEGRLAPRSLRLFRAPEQHGIGMLLSREDNGHEQARFSAC